MEQKTGDPIARSLLFRIARLCLDLQGASDNLVAN